MNRTDIEAIVHREEGAMYRSAPEPSERVLRRPHREDSVDRMGRMLVQRMIEAGVVEPL